MLNWGWGADQLDQRLPNRLKEQVRGRGSSTSCPQNVKCFTREYWYRVCSTMRRNPTGPVQIANNELNFYTIDASKIALGPRRNLAQGNVILHCH